MTREDTAEKTKHIHTHTKGKHLRKKDLITSMLEVNITLAALTQFLLSNFTDT